MLTFYKWLNKHPLVATIGMLLLLFDATFGVLNVIQVLGG